MADDNTGTPNPDATGAAAPTGTPPEGSPAPGTGTPPESGAPPGGAPDGNSDAPPADKTGEDNAVPETYAEFTLPEGYTLDEARNTEFGAFAKANGWTQDQAQQAVDLYMKMQTENETTVAEQAATQKTEWETTVKNDAEIGGADFEEKVATASAAIDKFGTPELKQALIDTGLGSHPELVRFAYRVGLHLNEDAQPTGSPGQKPTDQANLLYPSTAPKT